MYSTNRISSRPHLTGAGQWAPEEKRAPQFGEVFDNCIKKIQQAKELAKEGSLEDAVALISESQNLGTCLKKILKKMDAHFSNKRPLSSLEEGGEELEKPEMAAPKRQRIDQTPPEPIDTNSSWQPPFRPEVLKPIAKDAPLTPIKPENSLATSLATSWIGNPLFSPQSLAQIQLETFLETSWTAYSMFTPQFPIPINVENSTTTSRTLSPIVSPQDSSVTLSSVAPYKPSRQSLLEVEIRELLSSSETPRTKFEKLINKKFIINMYVGDKIIELLSNNIELLSIKDVDNNNIIHKFFYRAGVTACEKLLKFEECRSLINETNTAGETPLHLACMAFQNSREAKIKLLYSYGARVDVTDGQDRLPGWKDEHLREIIKNLWNAESSAKIEYAEIVAEDGR